MEDCTEFHQSEINRKIKANDKLRKILTTMPDEHRALIYGDSLQSKMRSLDDEKEALWPRSRKSTWRDSGKTSGRSSRHVGKIWRNGSKLTKNWSQQMPNKFKLKLWWQSKQRKTTKLLTKSSQEPNHKRRVPCQTKRHSKPSSQCSKLSLRCKAKAVTVFRSSSLRLVRHRRRRSRKSARILHTQCVNCNQRPLTRTMHRSSQSPVQRHVHRRSVWPKGREVDQQKRGGTDSTFRTSWRMQTKKSSRKNPSFQFIGQSVTSTDTRMTMTMTMKMTMTHSDKVNNISRKSGLTELSDGVMTS